MAIPVSARPEHRADARRAQRPQLLARRLPLLVARPRMARVRGRGRVHLLHRPVHARLHHGGQRQAARGRCETGQGQGPGAERRLGQVAHPEVGGLERPQGCSSYIWYGLGFVELQPIIMGTLYL